MKSLVENLGRFADVAAVLDKAIELGVVEYELDDVRKARKFRFRCYSYRTALRRLDEKRKGLESGLAPTSRYDMMEIILKPGNDCILVIRAVTPKGILRDTAGNVIDPLRAPPKEEPHADEQDYLAAAIKLLD
jgi:hypothetical protein